MHGWLQHGSRQANWCLALSLPLPPPHSAGSPSLGQAQDDARHRTTVGLDPIMAGAEVGMLLDDAELQEMEEQITQQGKERYYRRGTTEREDSERMFQRAT